MCRKSVKSVLLFLQQDHPCVCVCVRRDGYNCPNTSVKLYVRLQYCVSKMCFNTVRSTTQAHGTFSASWNTGTPGWYLQTSGDVQKECQVE